MRLHVVAVGRFGRGKAKAGPEAAVFHHYADRITGSVDLREVVAKRSLPPEQLKKHEADLLSAAIPEGAVVVALDGTGRMLSSLDLADRLGAWRDDGARDVAFVIGGAEGLDAGILARADLVLSLGPMTWPHLLVRGMLAEQLYRAQSILAGHPYHRE